MAPLKIHNTTCSTKLRAVCKNSSSVFAWTLTSITKSFDIHPRGLRKQPPRDLKLVQVDLLTFCEIIHRLSFNVAEGDRQNSIHRGFRQ